MPKSRSWSARPTWGLWKAARAVLASAALAGCTTAPREGYQAYSEAGASEGPAPLAELPPAAGAVVAVLENEARGVLTQRIVLKGDPGALGENALVVKIDRSRGPADYDGAVGPPTRARIAAELDETFAGVEMRLSETFARSGFGPFGYAVGHPRGGVTCVYAWSWGLAKPERLGDAPAGAPSLPTQATSVRARLCRSTLGEAQIVALLRGLQVYSPQTHMAYFDPGGAGAEAGGDALAAAGVGYYVGVEPQNVRRERLEPPRVQRRRAQRRRRERFGDDDARAVAAEAPGVAVPLPLDAGAPPAASNPLLAPLAAPFAKPGAELPLPERAAQAGGSAPLPK